MMTQKQLKEVKEMIRKDYLMYSTIFEKSVVKEKLLEYYGFWMIETIVVVLNEEENKVE